MYKSLTILDIAKWARILGGKLPTRRVRGAAREGYRNGHKGVPVLRAHGATDLQRARLRHGEAARHAARPDVPLAGGGADRSADPGAHRLRGPVGPGRYRLCGRVGPMDGCTDRSGRQPAAATLV